MTVNLSSQKTISTTANNTFAAAKTMTNPISLDFEAAAPIIDTKENDKQMVKSQLSELINQVRNLKEDSSKETKKIINEKIKNLKEYAEMAEIDLGPILGELLANTNEKDKKQITKALGIKATEAEVEEPKQENNFFKNLFGSINISLGQGNAKTSVPANIKNFDAMLDVVLKYEGGYVNDADDKGGETNKGITHTTYDSYRNSKGLPTQSVKSITNEEVQEIYYKNYYQASGAEQYAETNPELALAVFDASVNHGVGRAKQWLKESNGDLNVFMQKRADFYKKIVANNPSQGKFLKGWQNRWNDVNAKIGSEAQWA